jgi:hypothetical protein
MENIIFLIWSVVSNTGLGHSTGLGVNIYFYFFIESKYLPNFSLALALDENGFVSLDPKKRYRWVERIK